MGAAEDYFEQGRRKVDNDASPAPLLIVFERQSSTVLIAADEWTAPNANRLDQFVSAFLSSADQHANSIDMHDVSAFDTFGAWQLARLARALKSKGRELTITGLPERYLGLFSAVRESSERADQIQSKPRFAFTGLAALGETMAGAWQSLLLLLNMLGAVCAAAFRAILNPSTFRLTSTVSRM